MSVPDSIQDELARAKRLFPTWPRDPFHAVAILGEEFGELTKAIVEHTYEPHKSQRADVFAEAVQTAAMAIRFLENFASYRFEPDGHHVAQEMKNDECD